MEDNNKFKMSLLKNKLKELNKQMIKDAYYNCILGRFEWKDKIGGDVVFMKEK